MRSVTLKIDAGIVPAQVTLGHPGAILGDKRDARIQVRRISNVPDDVSNAQVIRLFARTADVTWLGGGQGRMEFSFSELGEGKIIKK